MSFRFNSEDFEGVIPRLGQTEIDAYRIRAQELLDAHVASLPKVFRNDVLVGHPDRHYEPGWWPIMPQKNRTKEARLWGIEELAPKKCEHVTARGIQVMIAGHNDLGGFETTCSLCGKRLIAKWQEG